MATMLGWYFAANDRRLGYGDGRKIAVGETHEIDGKPKLCERGLHASQRVIDALDYAPGPILYRVRLSGAIVHDDDKASATRRTYLAEIDATEMLRAFARSCARDVIDLWDAPEIVKRYLETGDETIRAAAWAAAWAAGAGAAATAAAWAARAAADAAWAAAWAAGGAATAAAWAAWAAAGAAWATAGAAAGDAWAADGAAAGDAWAADADARSKQAARLERMARAALATARAAKKEG
ncbi:MAG TPA: hypothetical protein VF188_16280 [Longimicrobiales bacterium]